MKKIYTHFFKTSITCLLFSLFINTAKSQTILSVGDIAFTGYNATPNSPQNEAFSFVILVNISAGTTINFTDNAWGNNNTFRTGEQTITWTTGSSLVAGREIIITGPAAGTATARVSGSNISAGTVSGAMLSLSVNGDQILAYQGSAASPTFISGIHMNVYSGGVDPSITTAALWDDLPSTTHTANSSFKPASFTTGTNAIWIGTQGSNASERNNAVYNCTGSLATPTQVRVAVNNQANWFSEFAASGAVPTWAPPSGCAFLASIFPLDIVHFNGNSEENQITLKWQTANEVNDRDIIELQKSVNGQNFNNIHSQNSQGFSYLYNNYSHIDRSPFSGANFYRLKIISPNGSVKYSSVIKVMFGKSGKSFVISPSIASNEITVSFSNNQFNQLSIIDMNGKIVLTQRLMTNNTQINISHLPAGQYSVSLMGNLQKITQKMLIAH